MEFLKCHLAWHPLNFFEHEYSCLALILENIQQLSLCSLLLELFTDV